MFSRSLAAVVALALLCGGLAVALRDDAPAENDKPAPARRVAVLPGMQPNGSVLLPTQWSLRPAGRHLPLGDFPVNLAVHPSGKYLAALHAGFGPHEVVIVDLSAKKEHITSRVTLQQAFYGLTFSPDGKTLFASGGEFEVVHSFRFS